MTFPETSFVSVTVILLQEQDRVEACWRREAEDPRLLTSSSVNNTEYLTEAGGVVAQDEEQVYGDEYADYGYDDPNTAYDDSLMASSADGNKGIFT